MKKNYQKLIGKTKKEIISVLGFEYNHYPANVWSYFIKISWIGLKTILLIYFNDGYVKEVRVVKTFSKPPCLS